MAPGSDAGAWAVPHGSLTEFSLLGTALGPNYDEILAPGIARLQEKF